MGRRGPAPKPTALKLVGGNPGKRPLNGAEPVPPSGAPDPPEFIVNDPKVMAIWNLLVPQLAAIFLARKIDGLVLARYCVLFSCWIADREFVAKHGTQFALRSKPTKADPKGVILCMKEYPASANLRKWSQSLLAIEREFGLSPAARTRIRSEVEKDADKNIDELKRRFFATAGTRA